METDRNAAALIDRIRDGFFGQPLTIELLLAAFGAQGHVILQGPPGTGKTLLAVTIARAAQLEFHRVQMTPDLMPSDLLGTSVWLPAEGRFDFRQGPLFTEVLLADELNRAPPKTQAALLEAMQERRITLDGKTHQLSEDFWVVATQNPLEQEGTYPLPDSQLDRFAMQIAVDHPADEAERRVLQRHRDKGDALKITEHAQRDPVLSGEQLTSWRSQIERVHLDEALIDYIHALVRATRLQPELQWGAGPRAGISLLRCSRALANIRAREYVIPDDVHDLYEPVVAHRLRLSAEAHVSGVTVGTVVQRILGAVSVPSAA